MKTAVVTDSNSGITQSQGKELGIFVVPMPFMIDGETFEEDISLTQEEFYEKLKEDADISTSQPSPETVMKLWDRILEEYDEIIHIPMSSSLSSSCQTALMLAEDYEGRVKVANNRRISITQRQAALDAQEMAKLGLGAQAICEELERKLCGDGRVHHGWRDAVANAVPRGGILLRPPHYGEPDIDGLPRRGAPAGHPQYERGAPFPRRRMRAGDPARRQ